MTEHILTQDHAALDGLFRELDLAFARGGEAGPILAALDLLWARLAVHVRAEQLCLFPAIIEHVSDGGVPRADEARAAIAELKEGHNFFMRELAEAVNLMRQAQGGGDRAREGVEEARRRVAAVRARLAGHNELEEGLVYVWPSLLLSEEERARLQRSIRREIENLPPRLADQRTSDETTSETTTPSAPPPRMSDT